MEFVYLLAAQILAFDLLIWPIQLLRKNTLERFGSHHHVIIICGT
jgi:hypothetical protein